MKNWLLIALLCIAVVNAAVVGFAMVKYWFFPNNDKSKEDDTT